MADCVTKDKACESQVLQKAQETFACKSFSVCLPFGGRLWSNGECIQYDEGTPPPDGVYSRIKIVNGCIVEATKAEIPLYSAPVCAPATTPCGDAEGGLPDPSTLTGNLFSYDPANRPLVKLTVRAGDGVAIHGTGTSSDPLIISANAAEAQQIFIQSGDSFIQVTGDGSAEDPYRIKHTGDGQMHTVMGITFDTAGHFVEYAAAEESSVIRGIVEGTGIKVDVDAAAGLATVSVADPLHPVDGSRLLGGWLIDFDKKNLIYDMSQQIHFPAATYQVGGYQLAVNEFGSAEEITQSIALQPGLYRCGHTDLTVNALGSITDIQPVLPTVVTHSLTKQFTAAANPIAVEFTTAVDSAFYIRYDATAQMQVATDVSVYIDDLIVQYDYFPLSTRVTLICCPPALYTAGAHKVEIRHKTEETLIPFGVLHIELTTIGQ